MLTKVERRKQYRRIKKELELPSKLRMSLSEGQIARFPQMKDRLEDTHSELLEWLYTRKLSEEVISQVNTDLNNPNFKTSIEKVKWFVRHPKTPMQIRLALLKDEIKLDQADYLYDNYSADLHPAIDAFKKGLDSTLVDRWYSKGLDHYAERALKALQKRQERDKDTTSPDTQLTQSMYTTIVENKASAASILLIGRAFREGRSTFRFYVSTKTYMRKKLLPTLAKGLFTVDLYERIFDESLQSDCKREALIHAVSQGVPEKVLLPYCDQNEYLSSIKSLTSRTREVVPPRETVPNHIINYLAEHEQLPIRYQIEKLTPEHLALWKEAKTVVYRQYNEEREDIINEHDSIYPTIRPERLVELFSCSHNAEQVREYIENYRDYGTHLDFDELAQAKKRAIAQAAQFPIIY